ncbi:hypothetical protein Pan14r_30030 [Crateriforma conspicua]|uniref:DUF4292 domain-containing protein n=2 Tax=Crateriforma conspicua TaxID=2527996 RepID=A0A5C5Y4N1_9PLAN|nr:hypothetical protein Mal65_44710 [Crateriforma conspicua]TWT70696.1 hypothetical protein Pan14r_30030 [Crateriforma conspicua]
MIRTTAPHHSNTPKLGRQLSAWLMLAVVFVCGGATCMPQRKVTDFPAPPPVLSDVPELNDVIAAVNRNDAVQQLSTNSASIQDIHQKTPRFTANVHLQREKDFRLRASLPIILGSGLDIGSNRDVFWFEVPDGMSRTMYFARHDQYQNQLQHAAIPVNPAWLIEAIGLVHLDPALVIQGPVRRDDGLLEIRSRMPDGIHQRVCYIDADGGFVTQQLLTKPTIGGGEILIAESRTADHRFYENPACVLPHKILLRLLPTEAPEMNLMIEVGDYSVNQILSGDPNLFVMPQTAPNIRDLTKLSLATPPAPTETSYTQQATLIPEYRGTMTR